MRIKFKNEKLSCGVHASNHCLLNAFLLLLCLYALPLNSFSANEKPAKKINLKVGAVLYYQLSATNYYSLERTQEKTSIEFKIIDKKDSLYTVVSSVKRNEYLRNDIYFDSNYPYYENNYTFPWTNKSFTFFLSESGIVQPIIVPDSVIQQRFREDINSQSYGGSILLYTNMIRNYQSFFRDYYQQFFIDWTSVERSLRIFDNSNAKNQPIIKDISINKDFSHLTTEISIQPIDTISPPHIYSWSNSLGSIKTDTFKGIITEAESTTTSTTKTTSSSIDISTVNYLKKSTSKIKQYVPTDDSFIKLTGILQKDCKPQSVKCFIYNNFMGSTGDYFLNQNIVPGNSFNFSIPLQHSISVALLIDGMPNGIFGNFLMEPGDSINLNISANGIEFSGKGALKNKLYKAMRESQLVMDDTYTEKQAKEIANKWVQAEQEKIEPFKEQLSWWAYNQIRCDIYYSAMESLENYYYYRNKKQVNAESFDLLFNDVKWADYHSTSSINLLAFIESYLFRKALILKGAKENETVSESEKYYLAEIVFKGQIKYLAQSQSVFNALKDKSIYERKNLFYNYEKIYKGTGYYTYLKNKLESRVDLGNGSTMPVFYAKDINRKKISLDKLKGKYVQFLFINLDFDSDKKVLKEYQKLKELPSNKFELVTVFVNKSDSLTDAYIKENKPKGILVKNPDWQIEQLKKFNAQASNPYYLINQEGIIVFSGAGMPTDYFVKMIIDMINNDTYNKAEASVSKSTLYWVLSLSVATILFSLVVVWLVPRTIKRREAIRREQLELKLGAVRSQLNPHFLFNAMSSIQFLVNHNEKEKANLFLSKFAQLMRKVLLQSETERVPLNDELENIKTYLELEALRHHFQYRVAVDEGIDLFNTEIPVMLLQPFVENAVIHGIAGMEEQGEIEISIRRHNEQHIQICITDNGNGISNNASLSDESNGKGMQITQKRAELMMEKYGHEIAFKIVNRKETNSLLNGTEVCITIETEK